MRILLEALKGLQSSLIETLNSLSWQIKVDITLGLLYKALEP